MEKDYTLKMENRGLLIYASSIQCADLLYSTNFSASDPSLYFEAGKKKYIVVPSLEYERAQLECKKGIVILDREAILSDTLYKTPEELLSKIMELYPCKTWILHKDFPFYLTKHLIDFMARNKLSSISKTAVGSFIVKRKRKNKYEIEEIRNALSLAEKAMLKAETILRDSKINNRSELIYQGKKLTSEFIKSEINIEIVRGGGNAPHGTIVASGKQTAIPHDTGTGVIKSNVPIIIDIFPRLEKTGYWGDITRTFVKGKASKIVKNAYLAVKEAKDYAKSKVATGIIPDKIHKETVLFLEKQGFKTGKKNNKYFGFFHGLGHGVGLEIHELPRLAPSVTTPLKAGDLFTIEPGVYYSEWGGIRLEDMVYLDNKGQPQFLNSYPDNLEIS